MQHELKALNQEELKESMLELIEIDDYSVILTLIDGEILFGDLSPDIRFFDTKPDEKEWYIKEEEDNSFFSVRLLPDILHFNDPKGEMYGSSFVINGLNIGIIASIKHVNWMEDLTPLRWIPNPYASIICKNNLKVAKKYNLEVFTYFESSLPTNKISHGITFEYDEMIYTDWEFISHLSGGTKGSIGGAGIGINLGRNLENIAIDKLKNGPVEKIINFVFTSPFNEGRVLGYLVMPEEEITTTIEGEECILTLCCENPEFNPQEKYMPVLLKKDSISYPKEFLPYLRSKLVFYGQVKQFPIDEQGIISEAVFMARAIGYLNNQP